MELVQNQGPLAHVKKQSHCHNLEYMMLSLSSENEQNKTCINKYRLILHFFFQARWIIQYQCREIIE